MPPVPIELPLREPAPSPRPGLRYLKPLDGLRGIAIVMVMLHNFTMTSATAAPLLGRAFEWGWVGVQLFFVMSGYLITRNLLAITLSPGVLTAFMVRRWLRIVPVCYTLLALYFWLVPLLFDAPSIVSARSTQLWYWGFLSNWAEPLGIAAPGLGHLWSLAVEVQFYLAWPLIIMIAGPRRLVHVCGVVIVLGLAAAIALRAGGASPMAVYKFTVTRMNALGMGALVAVLAERKPALRVPARALAWGAALGLLGVVVWSRGFDYKDAVVETAGFTLVALLFATWLLPIVGVAGSPEGLAVRVPSWSGLRDVGRLSYGMYVVHYPLHWAAMKRLYPRLLLEDGTVSTPRLGAYVAVASVATYLLARLVWALVERPVLALKRFFPPTGVRHATVRIKTLSARGQ